MSRLAVAGVTIVVAAIAGCDAPRPSEPDAGVELRGFAESCRTTEDCQSGLCLEVAPGRGVCTRVCDDDAECPDGEPWGCVSPRGLGARVCGCAADSDEELCGDGIDNECDGRVDDCRICFGLPVPEDAHDHCGECGRACRGDQECSSGECRCAIAGRTDCDGRCVDTASDDLHCGACGAACSVDRQCLDGACVCRADRPDRCVDASGIETCVDLQSDEESCGACGHRCPTGQVCLGGSCDCPDSVEVDHCGGVGCVDLDSDVAHCGACENACRAGELCTSGECVCPIAGRIWCDGACLDVASNTAHCGACGVSCLPGERCAGGACVCDSGIVCDGVCTRVDDPAHCGGCGNVCRGDELCAGGTCSCRFGVDCDGACTDVSSSETDCGACGVTCGSGQSCVSGSCRCALSGWIYCEATGACVDPRVDEQHCGGCSNLCPAGQECVSSTCRCPTGSTWCTALGACVDLRSDAASCGACGNACPAAQQCVSSTCRCPISGETYCVESGTCEPLASDRENCGTCGNVCPAALTCSSYSCRCPTAGQTYCAASDACFDLRTDPTSCGACGNVCPTGTTCSASACRCPTAGETLCGDTCADLTTDVAHCGACGNACTGRRTCDAGACRCPAPIPGPLRRLTTSSEPDTRIAAATDGERVAMVWQVEEATGERSIRFALVDFSGARVSPDQVLATAPDGHDLGPPDIAWSGSHWGVAWVQDNPTGDRRGIRFQRVASDGTPLASAADVTTHWPLPVEGTEVAVAYSAARGWAVATSPIAFQSLGLDGTARPYPVIPRAGGSATYPLDMAGAPDGRFGIVVNSILWTVDSDGAITQPFVSIGLGGARLAWDGEGFLAAGQMAGERIVLRRGPMMTEAHVLYEVPLDRARQLGLSVQGGTALISWTTGVSGSSMTRIEMARVGLPVGGASFTILTTASVVMPDYSASLERPELVQSDSSAVLAWSDMRWGQGEIYALPLELGACM